MRVDAMIEMREEREEREGRRGEERGGGRAELQMGRGVERERSEDYSVLIMTSRETG